MKRFPFILILLTASSAAFASTPYEVRVEKGVPFLMEYGTPQGTGFYETGRKAISLDGEWLFRIDPADRGESEAWNAGKVDESLWDTQDVPGVWQTQDPNLRFYDGRAWYRRSFVVPPDSADSAIFLRFEGANLFTKVWLNGTLLGEHEGGHTPFRFDISGAVRWGEENTLVVRCDNRLTENSVPPRTDSSAGEIFGKVSNLFGDPFLKGVVHFDEPGWWPYGGIHRSVYVEIVPKVNVVKVAVTATPEPGGGLLKVEGVVWNKSARPEDAKLTCELSTATGDGIASYDCGEIIISSNAFAAFRHSTRVEGVKPWSQSSPNLYKLAVTAEAGGAKDSVTVRIGFRSFEARDAKLWLNGKETFLYGVNRIEDDPAVGLAQTPLVIQNDLDMIHQMGANFIRPSHYPSHPAFLDECDERGIMVAEEIPLYQAGGGQLDDPEIIGRAKLQIAEMLERDVNHPSIVIWSLGNEVRSWVKSAGKLARELKFAARRMDPGRPVAMGLMVVPHVTNRRDFIAPEMDVLFINEYFGWFYGESEDAGRYLEFVHNTHPDKPIVVSEFGAHGLLGFHDPERKRVLSEEWQADFLLEHLEILTGKSYISGVAPWVFADYRCPWYSERPLNRFMSIAGLVDQRRTPKKSYFTVRDFYRDMRARR